LLKSEIGQKIYSGEARQAKWYSFLVDTKKRLADVLHADFDQVAYDSFTAASKAGVRDLLNSSFQAHGTYEFDVEYFGQERKMSVTPLSEVPAVMCEVLLRQVVVNTGQVQPMPWEKHIIDALGGHIPNLPTGVRVQTSLISDFVGGRQVWRKALASCRTYESMSREMRLARESTREIDSYSYLDEDFFNDGVPGLVEGMVRQMVLQKLPVLEQPPNDCSAAHPVERKAEEAAAAIA